MNYGPKDRFEATIKDAKTQYCLWEYEDGSNTHLVCIEWATTMRNLSDIFKKWASPSWGICAISFVFTDAPFQLSKFAIDAVLIWDGATYSRVELTKLPQDLKDALEDLQADLSHAFLFKVGDGLKIMRDRYGHELVVGQAYVTPDFLTVWNIRGNSAWTNTSLKPDFPYPTATFLNGFNEGNKSDTLAHKKPSDPRPVLEWIIANQDQARVSEAHARRYVDALAVPMPQREDISEWIELLKLREGN